MLSRRLFGGTPFGRPPFGRPPFGCRQTAPRRFNAPLITPTMLKGTDGENINGPSLISVPDWLPGRLGSYYLYFAHHNGAYIRLAYADHLEGPWRIHDPGTLHLHQAPAGMDHIASPDVHVDHVQKRIRMYYHGRIEGQARQYSYRAESPDGLDFQSSTSPIADFYLRMLPWRDEWIGMSKGGVMYRSADGIDKFTRLPKPAFRMADPEANAPGDVRHVALALRQDRLAIYFTRIGDKPERILLAHLSLDGPCARWRAKPAGLVLRPEMQWEGADITPARSRAGAASGRENALRDPAFFTENGQDYLLYSIAGESGIAIASLGRDQP